MSTDRWMAKEVWYISIDTTKYQSSVQSLSRVQLFATPWIAARQASLSITNSQSSLRLMSIESVMPSRLGTYWPGEFLFQYILSFCLFVVFMGFSRQEYWSGLPFPSPADHIVSDLSTMPARLGWPHRAWLSFIELDKAVDKKEWNNATCCNMKGPGDYHTKRIKSEKDKYHIFICGI